MTDQLLPEYAMSQIGRDRMRILIAHMRSLPAWADKHFGMNHFLSLGEGKTSSDVIHVLEMENPTPETFRQCGATACALGWALTCPELAPQFIKQDLVLSSFRVFGFDYDTQFPFDYTRHVLFNRFFGHRNNDRTPKDWARRAEKALADIESKIASEGINP